METLQFDDACTCTFTPPWPNRGHPWTWPRVVAVAEMWPTVIVAAVVTMADGTPSRIDALKEGDEIAFLPPVSGG